MYTWPLVLVVYCACYKRVLHMYACATCVVHYVRVLAHFSLSLSLSLTCTPQLSSLSLQSQRVPFQCEDLAVISPSNQELLAQCQEELNEVRVELDQKLEEVESLHGELASLRGEQEATRTQLEEHRRMLQAAHQERNHLDQEVGGGVT